MVDTEIKVFLDDFILLSYKLRFNLDLDYYDKKLLEILEEYCFYLDYRQEFREKNLDT